MHTWKSKDSCAWVLILSHETEQVKFLRKIKIPWWKGGGERYIFVHRLNEATFMDYHSASRVLVMYEESQLKHQLEIKSVGLIEK